MGSSTPGLVVRPGIRECSAVPAPAAGDSWAEIETVPAIEGGATLLVSVCARLPYVEMMGRAPVPVAIAQLAMFVDPIGTGRDVAVGTWRLSSSCFRNSRISFSKSTERLDCLMSMRRAASGVSHLRFLVLRNPSSILHSSLSRLHRLQTSSDVVSSLEARSHRSLESQIQPQGLGWPGRSCYHATLQPTSHAYLLLFALVTSPSPTGGLLGIIGAGSVTAQSGVVAAVPGLYRRAGGARHSVGIHS